MRVQNLCTDSALSRLTLSVKGLALASPSERSERLEPLVRLGLKLTLKVTTTVVAWFG